MAARRERQTPPNIERIKETYDVFNERKLKDPSTYAYDPKIGEELLELARIPGHPICTIRAKYYLYNHQLDAWGGIYADGRYFQEHYMYCYNKFIDERRAWLDELAIESKIDKEVWRNVAWSQLSAKIQPPKEVKTESDVRTTMQVGDLHDIIAALESKKGSTGF